MVEIVAKLLYEAIEGDLIDETITFEDPSCGLALDAYLLSMIPETVRTNIDDQIRPKNA